jgi:hypothetical protein
LSTLRILLEPRVELGNNGLEFSEEFFLGLRLLVRVRSVDSEADSQLVSQLIDELMGLCNRMDLFRRKLRELLCSLEGESEQAAV